MVILGVVIRRVVILGVVILEGGYPGGGYPGKVVQGVGVRIRYFISRWQVWRRPKWSSKPGEPDEGKINKSDSQQLNAYACCISSLP